MRCQERLQILEDQVNQRQTLTVNIETKVKRVRKDLQNLDLQHQDLLTEVGKDLDRGPEIELRLRRREKRAAGVEERM